MEIVIVPEPTPPQREAIVAALDDEPSPQEPPAYRSRWLRDALERSDAD